MTIQYNVEELRTNSTKLLTSHEAMNTAIRDKIGGLVTMLSDNWKGKDSTTYVNQLSDKVGAISSYLDELKIIAENLNTAADLYEKHEETYSASLW